MSTNESFTKLLSQSSDRGVPPACHRLTTAMLIEGRCSAGNNRFIYYVKEKERNSINSEIWIYEARSDEYIHIYESIAIEFFLRLKIHRIDTWSVFRYLIKKNNFIVTMVNHDTSTEHTLHFYGHISHIVGCGRTCDTLLIQCHNLTRIMTW